MADESLSTRVDPWSTTYTSDSSGQAAVSIKITALELGFDPRAAIGRTVVVHSSDAKIACGVLLEQRSESTPTPTPAASSNGFGFDSDEGELVVIIVPICVVLAFGAVLWMCCYAKRAKDPEEQHGLKHGVSSFENPMCVIWFCVCMPDHARSISRLLARSRLFKRSVCLGVSHL